MGIEIKRAPESIPTDDKYIRVTEPIFLNDKRNTVVKADSSEASFVLVAKNGLLSLTDAKKYGIEYLFDIPNGEPVVVKFPEEIIEEEDDSNEILSQYYQQGINEGYLVGFQAGFLEGFKSGFIKRFESKAED